MADLLNYDPKFKVIDVRRAKRDRRQEHIDNALKLFEQDDINFEGCQVIYVALVKGCVVGALLRDGLSDEVRIVVHKDYRRCGIASALLYRAETLPSAWATPVSKASTRLLRKVGWYEYIKGDTFLSPYRG